MPVIDNIFILPCLQEKKVQNEYEQNGSIIKSYNSLPTSIVPSEIFNKIWEGSEQSNLPSEIELDSRKSLSFFKSKGNLFKGACKNVLTIDKWRIYGNFLLNQCETNQDIVSFLITHHNRLRGIPKEKYNEVNPEQNGGFGWKDLAVSAKSFTV